MDVSAEHRLRHKASIVTEYPKVLSMMTLDIYDVMQSRLVDNFNKYEIEFFKAIPSERYSQLGQVCKIGNYKPNKVIFKEGDPSDEDSKFYIIVHGEVQVTGGAKFERTNQGLQVARV